MFYASKEELEAAERRPKGYVAYRRKDGAWIYVTASTARGSATQRRCDAIVREKYEAAMAEKRRREADAKDIDATIQAAIDERIAAALGNARGRG
jgi:crotonobetainyl-CoA:carnitine CoA-transferase CaiB-like acyl-CoA transferase